MNSHSELENLLQAHHEWLLIDPAGRSFALDRTEIEFSFDRGRTLVGFLDEKGFQTWRVAGFSSKNDEIILNLSRNFERERARVRLVPRARAGALSDAVELARLDRAQKIAALLAARIPPVKVRRVALNRDNGRFAQIIVEDARKKQTAVLSDVSDHVSPEALLARAILWLAALAGRKKNPIERLWLAAEKKQAKVLQKLHALLGAEWKSKISIKEIAREDAGGQPQTILKDLPALDWPDLWRGKVGALDLAEKTRPSRAARRIVRLAPARIDSVFSRHGETLRFNGLPFARVRRVFEEERIWFGVEKSKQVLGAHNLDEFSDLIERLREFRCASTPNRRHAFYKDAPEAWLEADLRRNIRLLDANLILSPLYHQFRAERERVDLLALRRDGRLVIIEVKTAPDREMAFQVADYWRRIERLRRRGVLQKSGLFGELEIADAPAVCYLAAPTLSFHRDFEFLAAALAPEIEMHRFNLAENWRARLKVLERREIGKIHKSPS